MAEGCNERIEKAYFKWIWDFPKKYRPGVLKVLELYQDKKNIVILKNRRETEKFLESLKNRLV